MAIVSISKIQIRRGLANQGTGLPQLASGEMAWAVDTQELYIGSGAVSEGAPAVDNIKILTLNDLSANGNVLGFLQYVYKVDSPNIETGLNGGITPVSIQHKLDEYVTVEDFGIDILKRDGTADVTAYLQLAIDQLYLNTPHASAPGSSILRVKLQIPSGTYKTTSTLYIPSFVTLEGAGAGKTIIKYQPTTNVNNPAIQFVNDLSTPGNPSPIIDTQGIYQPRNIRISGLTIKVPNSQSACMQLDAVRDSIFEEINLEVDKDATSIASVSEYSVGLIMNAASTHLATCENNVFRNLNFDGLYMAVSARYDIINNTFENCNFTKLNSGIYLGEDSAGNQADQSTLGQRSGPQQTQIINCKFDNVYQQAINVIVGTTNIVENCRFVNVGSLGGGLSTVEYPEIYFNTPGNIAKNNYSDRALLSFDPSLLTFAYIPELAGYGTYTSYGVNTLALAYSNSYEYLFRLPCQVTKNGIPTSTVAYTINYTYKSNNSAYSRQGTITLVSNVDYIKIQLSDDFNFTGLDENKSTLLDFQSHFLDTNGDKYTSAPGQVPSSIGIFYADAVLNDIGTLTYSYTATF
jgi:hypothetical protein